MVDWLKDLPSGQTYPGDDDRPRSSTIMGGWNFDSAQLDFPDDPERPDDERNRIFSMNYCENFEILKKI